ncbi:MAG: efflux RND transporter periplasmic adaptor subunit [Beijerinckiaceae bacterium]
MVLSLLATVALAGNTAAFAADPGSPSNSAGTYVLVARAVQSCLSDTVRFTGYLVPRRELQIPFEADGYRITDVSAREGDSVTPGQQLAKLVRIGDQPQAARAAPRSQAQGTSQPAIVRAPVAGIITKVAAPVGSIASPRAEPLFRIAVDGQIELEAEVPGPRLSKLKPDTPARVEVGAPHEIAGRVRRTMVEINSATQLGRVRISLDQSDALRLGTFARASIDATQRCGVSVPRSAVAYGTTGASLQVVHDRMVESRSVRVGLASQKDVEVLEGVAEGDLVVAHAGTSLRDGETVTAIFADEFGQASVRQ